MEPLDFVNGMFSMIFVFLSLFIGILILLKYIKYKERIFLIVSFVWILIGSPWWPSSLSFLIALNNNVGLPLESYFTLGNVFVPVAVALWLVAFTEFLYTEKRKLILLIFVIYGSIFEIIFFILLLIDPNLIGNLNPPVDVSFKSFIMVYLLSFLLIFVISGLLFARLSLKSEDPEVRFKGKMLVGAYIAFLIGSVLDSVLDSSVPISGFIIIFTRLILILSAFFWYAGFFLPRWIKKLFLKKGPTT